ncbi:hypothetical protein A11A3_00555 [Alcanivorax hongdengensis A-11-3]|uniref:DUF11 domain-containing protein n=2 Tax=Alcanivorax hongdengensis TaxID=519051 RepID=L0WGW7_9GAMM|nr:hypothetical protein A11A3_00555 [Alcanivorax hongdengensis A-11-3]
MLLALASGLLHAATAPGTVLYNQADVRYLDPLEGQIKTLRSNVSRVVVGELRDLMLDNGRQTNATPAQTVSFNHVITNTGNVADRYTLTVSNDSGDDGELQGVTLYQDVNGNGVADAGEPAVTQTPVLAPGASLALVISAAVASSQRDGDHLNVSLKAQSQTDGALSAQLTDTVAVGSGAFLVLNKTTSQSCDVPLQAGQSLQYRITFTNTGSNAPAARTFQVSGQALDGVMVEDALPGNVSLVANSLSGLAPVQGIAVVHLTGASADSWQRFDQWNGVTPLDRFGVLMPALGMEANESGGFAFAVTINPGLTDGTMLFNRASVDTDGDGTADFTSNQVCNRVSSTLKPQIVFQKPAPDVIRSGRAPVHDEDSDFEKASIYSLVPEQSNQVLKDGVYIQLNAAQLNQSRVAADYVETTASGLRLLQATVSSTGTGDSVRVVLLETGVSTGVFRSVYPLVLSDMRAGNGGLCPATAAPGQLIQYDSQTTTGDAMGLGCVLQAQSRDSLKVSFQIPVYGADGNIQRVEAVNDVAAVDPAGTVFDSRNGQPLANAVVSLYQSRQTLAASGASRCADLAESDYRLAVDPYTGDTLKRENTGSQAGDNSTEVGRYQYPYASPGYCYYLDVTPPAGYHFPSTLSPAAAKSLYDNISDSSYGLQGYQPQAATRSAQAPLGRAAAVLANNGAFPLGAANVFVDIPLDADANTTSGTLVLDKQVDKDEAAVGDVLSYSIDLTNNDSDALYAAKIIDTPPYGFRYVPGSTWLSVNDTRIAIPEPVRNGSALTFLVQKQNPDGSVDALPIAAGNTVTVHYALRLSAGAVDSNGINRATGYANSVSGYTYSSNEDQAKVTIRNEGVLSDKAMLFGKVYVDADCNNLQNDGEWPIGGVKLYLQDGTWVITDENGQYSIYGLKPGLNTIKVDPLTLPQGVQLKPIDNRNAADPESRFVDLRPGEYHRADFAAICPSGEQAEALARELKERNRSISGDWMLDQAARFDPLRNQDSGNRLRQADGSGDLGSGVYTQTGDQSLTQAWEKVSQGRNAPVPAPADAPAAAEPAAMKTTQEVAASVTHEQAMAGTWLWPKGPVSRDGRFQVVVRAGVEPHLYVNGQAVASSQLGEQVLNKRQQAQVLTWYGVRLQEGANTVQVKTRDMFGNERVMAEKTVSRPAAAHALQILPANSTLPADGGRSSLPVRIRLNDAWGNAVLGSYFVTLETDRGQWLESDLQSGTPGFQVRLVDGEALVHLRSTEYTGPVRIKASVDSFIATADIEQVAPLRPLLATGFIQVKSRVGSLHDKGVAPSDPMDELDDDTSGRAALFMKGRVKGDAHLTLAYDTHKDLDEEDEIRRDLNPADYYPIPGDASIRGYDARSRSKLYAKLEKGRSSLMWGDYLTDSQGDTNDLGRTQKTLTGLNAVYDDDVNRFQVFAARPELDQVTEELPGNGTALLFTLGNRPSRDSETVEIITRDRDNPGLVIDTRTLTRYLDYSVNYFTGDIRFHDVVPTVDANLNPVFVRVSYNIEGDQEEYNVFGARVSHQFNDQFGVTVGRTVDENDTDGFDLTSVSAQYKPDSVTTLSLSTASMSHENNDPEGRAFSLSATRKWQGGSSTDLRWARAEQGFDNPASGISEAREELRLEHEQKLAADLSLNVEGIRSRQLDGDDEQNSLGVIGEKRLGRTSLRAGARGIDQQSNQVEDRFGTYILGASQGFSLLGRPAQIGTDYEQAFADTGRRRIAADGDVQITDKTSLYGRYELINSLSGISTLSDDVETQQFTMGVRSAVSRNTDVYSEYRLRGAVDGRDVAAANGVKSDLEIEPGLTVTPSMEWIQTLDGQTDQDSTALSVGLEDKRNANRRSLLRAETRFGSQRTYYGLSAANIWRLNLDWSGVVREDLHLQYFDEQAREGENIVTLGLARRPRRDNRHHMLFMYKWKEEWGGDAGVDRTVHLLSTHHNYQPLDNWIFSGRLGGKWQTTHLGALSVDTDAYVADGRIIWDMTRRFDLDLHGGVLTTQGWDEQRYSYGIAVNALVRRNLRMGIGYNAAGFRDNDLDPEGYNAEGVYVGLEYKFDEDDLGWLGSKAAGQRSYMGE